MDKHYEEVIHFLRNEKDAKISRNNDLFNHLKRYSHQLSLMCADERTLILKNEAILVPKLRKPEILKLVHKVHFGYEKMIQNLKDKVWLPNLNNDVKNVVSGCQTCIENADKQLE